MVDQPLDARHRELLARAREIAARELSPRANATDQAAVMPLENARCLAEAGLLGLSTPIEYGGHGAPPEVLRAFMEIIAGACGVTIFVLFQHIVACRHIAAGENEALKAALLPRLAAGKSIATVAFSHLRRPGPPMLRVKHDGEDHVFDGEAPWATGWGVASEVLIAGSLPDGSSVWVVAPLVESDMMRASPPMRLCGMNASTTVSLECRGLRVGPERYVKTVTPEELARDTRMAVLFFTSLSLGAAAGACAVIRAIAEARGSAAHADAAAALEHEISAARTEVNRVAAQAAAPTTSDDVLRVRAWCVELGVRAAHAAVTASSGGANLLDHPAQRIFREAMVYTLTAQTTDLQIATLARLVRSGG
jgi:alkylation response protein AidB-like acyl-CoA dehydrogenase